MTRSATLLPRGVACLPAPTGAEAAAFDRLAQERDGVPGAVLMESAGRAAADLLQRLHPQGPVLVVAGAGKNGGDGLVLARTLVARGRNARLLVVGRRPHPDPLLHGWHLERRDLLDAAAVHPEHFTGAAVIVDALLGTGLSGAPRRLQGAAIEAMNDARAPVLALDLPSGVDADTGAVPGAAVRAVTTAAFGAPKLGTLLHPGRTLAGRIVALEIGFPPWGADDASALCITPGWAHTVRPRRSPTDHKNAGGRLLLVAGSPGMAGAAVLAARAALRAGVGYLRLALPASLFGTLHDALPEVVLVDAGDREALRAAVESSDALALGPGLGLGEKAAAALSVALEAFFPGSEGAGGEGAEPARGLVLDADALNLLAAARIRLPTGLPPDRVLLTPHPGEAARLLEEAGAEGITADPVAAAGRIARRFNATVLLKGAPSLVASPEARPALLALEGSSDLARAGMGDVLTGAAGAFAARGLDARTAGALALHATGRSALLAGRGEALLPSEVAEGIQGALAPTAPAHDDPLSSLETLLLDLPAVH